MTRNKTMVEQFFRLMPAVVGLLMTLFVGSCSNDSTSSNRVEESLDLVIINDESISVETYRKELIILEKKFRIREPGKLSEEEWILLKTQALNQVVQNALFRQEAAKSGIMVTPEELQEARQNSINGYQEDTFEKFLELNGIRQWQ